MTKKKIGFIDLFIDEWHANNYPQWIRQTPRADEFELGLAWEEAAKDGGRPLDAWCKEFEMTPAKSIEEVVENSDCIFVLAPSNPEVHQRLADLPLRSGKPVYVDKPFTSSKASAEQMFALADQFRSPLMSSSALRFGDGLLAGEIQAIKPEILCTTGGGRSFDEYGIHQLEMIVSVLGTDVKNIRLNGDSKKLSLLLEYSDGRLATAAYSPFMPFTIRAGRADQHVFLSSLDNMFENLLASVLDFFATGKSPINPAETICIADLLERAVHSLHNR